MNDDEHQELAERIFSQAIDLPEDERREFLKEHLEELPGGVRSEIESLLEVHKDEGFGDFLRSVTSQNEGTKLPSSEKDATEDTEALTDLPRDSSPTSESIPKQIDRFEIINLIGEGAFGRVYLAHDSDMHRKVALKVPSQRLFSSGDALETFVREARITAGIKHPGLITVYDVRRDSERPYIVQEYVEGCNLADWLRQNKPNMRKIVELIIDIAEALVEVHRHDLVHRDLKPANILISENDHVQVADFGIALHSSWQQELKGEIAGSPAYMSPEQTRGETHRIDGRSDIWSLGVILYEMLVGQRPFAANSRVELWEAIQYADVRPPSMRNPNVPSELDRICLVCLSKQQSDRYKSATHLLHDLKDWLSKSSEPATVSLLDSNPQTPAETVLHDTDRQSNTSQQPTRIIPRGLRSFEQSDADFYLMLLPGVPDKFGLPPDVSFWKSRIDETDSDSTFSVGVMYGPSGCGKSSLVKAGIIPRVGDHVSPIYVEATPNDTENRLLRELAKRARRFPVGETDLASAIQKIRNHVDGTQKVLIILDQFEQWLHEHADDPSQQLMHSLRQCDGGKIQCLLLIRDDFWTPVTRFMRHLDIRLVEGETVRSVDLFSKRHAEKVLTKFGQSYGALPEELDAEHETFLENSITGLARGGKVISVQIALFAQMMQDRYWTPESLSEVGGAEGVGETFLEETFSSSMAPKRHRTHLKASRAILELLLPDTGTDIKGAMRSHRELLTASGYEHRADDFDELMHILDAELRLITPTDAEELPNQDKDQPDSEVSSKFYQLTHDYLVPSLRQWLDKQRKVTRRGRAELRLTELASLWKEKKEKRRLPTFWEYLTIRFLTGRKAWTKPQSEMMKKAGALYATRVAVIAAILTIVSWGAYEYNGHLRSDLYIATLKNARANTVLESVADLNRYRRWADPKLSNLIQSLDGKSALSADERKYLLHARLAMVENDDSHYDALKEELLTQQPAYLVCLRDALAPYKTRLIPELREVVNNANTDQTRRIRAGFALASYLPGEEWNARDLMEPGKLSFFISMLDGFRDKPRVLTDLLCVASPTEFGAIYAKSISIGATATMLPYLEKKVESTPDKTFTPNQRLRLGQERASAAFTLIRMGHHEKIFDALRVIDDAETLTQFIHGCRNYDVTSNDLVKCLHLANDSRKSKHGEERRIYNGILYGLMLALGEFERNEIPKSELEMTIEKLKSWFRDDPSSGIHGASRWLLSKWREDREVMRLEHREVPYSPNREWYIVKVFAPEFHREPFFMTFVVFRAGEYTIGSPEQEPLRTRADESQHRVSIDYDFAIMDRELTFRELGVFNSYYLGVMNKYGYGKHHPAMGINWYDSVRFCRWLTEIAGGGETKQCYPDEKNVIQDGGTPDANPRANGAPKNWPVNLTKGGFRLPTGAEIEIAQRGGDIRGAFHFGNDSSQFQHYDWFDGNSKLIQLGRRLKPNIRGLFDVHGNVSEWSYDWFSRDNNRKDVINPSGPKEGTLRVLRGGSYFFPHRYCRSAGRQPQPPTYVAQSLGIRLAVVPTAGNAKTPAGSSE